MTEYQSHRASDFEKQPWHLDKSVPIGLIAAILLQTAAAIWWSATISARVDQLEAVALDNKSTGPRLAVLESQLADIKAALLRIEARIAPASFP